MKKSHLMNLLFYLLFLTVSCGEDIQEKNKALQIKKPRGQEKSFALAKKEQARKQKENEEKEEQARKKEQTRKEEQARKKEQTRKDEQARKQKENEEKDEQARKKEQTRKENEEKAQTAKELSFLEELCQKKDTLVTWWDDNFQKRQKILLDLRQEESLSKGDLILLRFDHQNLVNDGLANNVGLDLRLLYWDGTKNTELARALNNTWNTQSTEITFKLHEDLAAKNYSDQNYWLYFDHPNANNANLPYFYSAEAIKGWLVQKKDPQKNLIALEKKGQFHSLQVRQTAPQKLEFIVFDKTNDKFAEAHVRIESLETMNSLFSKDYLDDYGNNIFANSFKEEARFDSSQGLKIFLSGKEKTRTQRFFGEYEETSSDLKEGENSLEFTVSSKQNTKLEASLICEIKNSH